MPPDSLHGLPASSGFAIKIRNQDLTQASCYVVASWVRAIMVQRVHIEARRIQTWLFSVPRLRAMVGANAILADVLRDQLQRLALETNDGWTPSPLPDPTSFPTAMSEDPLGDIDNPQKDAANGIVSRDGGHFEVELASGAGEFAAAASELIRTKAPGLSFSIQIDGKKLNEGTGRSVAALPIFEPCEMSGRELASQRIKMGNDTALVSPDVANRYTEAVRVEDGGGSDLASRLLRKAFGDNHGRPRTFDDIAGRGYMAVLHADGNGVGAYARQLQGEGARQAFFHRNRVLLRQALGAALEDVEPSRRSQILPLMLGGDDLLLVCAADLAFSFIVSLCSELSTLQKSGDHQHVLTLGAGVVFSQPSVPFYHLHDLAEALAASAKIGYRASNGEVGSVVDWETYTASYGQDPIERRRQQFIRRTGDGVRLLIQRPIPVIGDTLGCLQGLIEKAKKLEDAPRSQLRSLVNALDEGLTISQLSLQSCPARTRQALESAGINRETLWFGEAEHVRQTALRDLVEVLETKRLGKRGIESAQ